MSPKPGRPKSDNPRDVSIRIRVTPEEAEIIKANARDCGATVSEYTRAAWNLIGVVLK